MARLGAAPLFFKRLKDTQANGSLCYKQGCLVFDPDLGFRLQKLTFGPRSRAELAPTEENGHIHIQKLTFGPRSRAELAPTEENGHIHIQKLTFGPRSRAELAPTEENGHIHTYSGYVKLNVPAIQRK